MLNEVKKNKFMKLVHDNIDSSSKASLLLLLSSVTEDMEMSIESDLEKPELLLPEVLEIKAYIVKSLCNLENDMTLTTNDHVEKIKEIGDLRARVAELYRPIPICLTQLRMIVDVLESEIKLQYAKQEVAEIDFELQNSDFSLFYTKCQTTLESMEGWSLETCTKEILKSIPMRMAKSLFYDLLSKYLSESFEDKSKQDIALSLENIRNTLMLPTAKGVVASGFEGITEFVKQNFKISTKGIHAEELERNVSKIYENYIAPVRLIENQLNTCLQDLSSLIILFASGLEFEEIIKNPIYKDLYYMVCNQLKDGVSDLEKEAFIDRILEDLDEVIEVAIDRATTSIDKKKNFIEKLSDDEEFDEETRTELHKSTLIMHYYFETLEDTFIEYLISLSEENETNEFCTKDEVSNIVDNFIEEIKTALGELSPPLRKKQMQVLKSLLPIPMDIEHIMAEIKYGVDSCSTLEQKLILVENIDDIFSGHDKIIFEDNDNDNDYDFGDLI